MALHFISSFLPLNHFDIPFFLSFLLSVNLDLAKTSTTTFANVNFDFFPVLLKLLTQSL